MNEVKDKIKPFLSEYVQEITKKSGGKNQYICPFCNSGMGNNHSGAFTVYPDTDTYFCFACQQSGDIFSLYGALNNISDFKTVLNELSNKYGIVTPTATNSKDYTKFFAFAESNLYKTDYLTRRGISTETQRKFRCGYVSDFRYQENRTTTAVIIPTSDTSFMWRSTTENIKQKRGTAHILNIQALDNNYCFVVEGEIDCMSVTECGFSCIGLGSTSNIKKIFDYDTSKTVLIIAMDNDGAGQKATGELEKLCMNHRTAFITAPSDVWNNCKDANEALVNDRKRLTESLQSLVRRAESFDRAEYLDQLKKKSEADEPEQWEQPESFDKVNKPAPFPMQNLPPLLREYLQAVSDYVQVVPEMSILPLLSVLSLCVQGKAVIKHTGNSHTEPLNLYTITVASPGERKSGSLKEFMKPIDDFQKRYNKIHALEIDDYKTERAYLENKRAKALKTDLQAAKTYAKQLASLERKHELVLNVSDATPEALAMEMYRQGGKIGIIDDEGSVFDVLSGIYSNGQANINIFLKAYDGANYTILRRTKENIELKKPLLTMGLMVQPEHFTEAMNNRQFVGRGFIHRFLFSFPESRAGHLKMTSPDVSPKLQKQYSDLINRLLRMPSTSEMPVIVCDREAELLFSDYFSHLQKEIRDGGTFENLKEWASKQFGRALRIAGILHICEHEPSKRLTGQTAMNSIAIATWAENHALNALSGSASEPTEIKNAKYILQKLKKSDKDTLSKHELLILCRPLKTADCVEPLDILEDMNCIRIEIVRNGERGKPKERIKINPLIKNI
ncbi:MAG: DUF3987 domain-containing protein [Ruminococcus sp.]|nr:DUF3987 domain-containing protein [Ruminococcus sp.]